MNRINAAPAIPCVNTDTHMHISLVPWIALKSTGKEAEACGTAPGPLQQPESERTMPAGGFQCSTLDAKGLNMLRQDKRSEPNHQRLSPQPVRA